MKALNIMIKTDRDSENMNRTNYYKLYYIKVFVYLSLGVLTCILYNVTIVLREQILIESPRNDYICLV